MAQWNTSDTGILRKNKPTENLEELLVFGYACKLFRDDEKAQYIDQGKHLIPWMGDETLKIDRYDCRGALSILKQYEASREGYDATRWLGLSDSERKLEELCDKERYYSLEINEEEEEMYKEEEQKRQKTNAYQYSYDVPKDPDSKEEIPTVPEKEEEDEEYIPLPTLDVPVDIEIPETVKQYARIEKTAFFVCKQGPQMEILIKAKQGDNPQFGFLTQGDKLYKFYRHVLAAFKNGRYQPQYASKKPEEKQEVSHEQDHSGDYLHPSLISNVAKSEPSTPASAPPPYRPSANCAYSQLVTRIQGNSSGAQDQAGSYGLPFPNYGQLTAEQQQQYYMYYYVQQYYEYYKHMMQTQGDSAQSSKLPAHFQQLDNNMQNYVQQLAFAQYMQQQQQPQHSTSTSYAQIVSNLNKEGVNPYVANMPQLPPPEDNSQAEIPSQPNNNDETQTKETVIEKPLLSLAAAYGSGSDSDESDDSQSDNDETPPSPRNKTPTRDAHAIPTGDTQIVIDKMAAYVSKNGEQFEEIVKAKGDPRFDFLNATHEFNEYYKWKIGELKGGKTTAAPEGKAEVKKEEEKTVKKQAKVKRVIAPVCFSIKKAKEEQPKEIKSALPVEDSDEEISENVDNCEDIPSTTTNKSTSAQTCNKSETTIVAVNETSTATNEPPTVARAAEVKQQESGTKPDSPIRKLNGILDPDDPILEMMDGPVADLTKDAKRAEDKIKDKLATAAREKLASVARDKALQLERKRKAAAFLKLKSAESSNLTPEKITNVVQKSPSNSRKSPGAQKSPKSESSRRNSVEMIFEENSIVVVNADKPTEKERSRSRERKNLERLLTHKEKHKTKEIDKRKSSCDGKESVDKEEKKKKKEKNQEKSHKKKKSHKRKRSKSGHESSKSCKKKSKKHRRKSASFSTTDGSDGSEQ